MKPPAKISMTIKKRGFFSSLFDLVAFFSRGNFGKTR